MGIVNTMGVVWFEHSESKQHTSFKSTIASSCHLYDCTRFRCQGVRVEHEIRVNIRVRDAIRKWRGRMVWRRRRWVEGMSRLPVIGQRTFRLISLLTIYKETTFITVLFKFCWETNVHKGIFSHRPGFLCHLRNEILHRMELLHSHGKGCKSRKGENPRRASCPALFHLRDHHPENNRWIQSYANSKNISSITLLPYLRFFGSKSASSLSAPDSTSNSKSESSPKSSKSAY